MRISFYLWVKNNSDILQELKKEAYDMKSHHNNYYETLMQLLAIVCSLSRVYCGGWEE